MQGFAFDQYDTDRPMSRGAVTIMEYQRGLLYRNGAFVRLLPPGRYRIWPFSRQIIRVLDIRRQTAHVANQKLLTQDQVAVGISLSADFHIADPVLAAHSVTSAHAQLYGDLQLVTRDIISGVSIDALLAERARINEAILERTRSLAAAYGMQVHVAAIKDVILTPRVRDLLMKEVETRRLAQSALIAAREEVATLRALANAARLAEQHPHLLKLRELEAVRAFAQAGGNTVLFGVHGDAMVPRPSAKGGSPPQETESEGDPQE